MCVIERNRAIDVVRFLDYVKTNLQNIRYLGMDREQGSRETGKQGNRDTSSASSKGMSKVGKVGKVGMGMGMQQQGLCLLANIS